MAHTQLTQAQNKPVDFEAVFIALIGHQGLQKATNNWRYCQGPAQADYVIELFPANDKDWHPATVTKGVGPESTSYQVNTPGEKWLHWNRRQFKVKYHVYHFQDYPSLPKL